MSCHILAGNNNNNNINSRKRGREDQPGVGNNNNNTITTASNVINQFSLQSQPLQLVHLSQLHNHQQQNNVVSTGLRLSFDDQHFQQQQRLQLHQNQSQQQQQHGSQSSAFLSLLSQGLGSQIKQQRDEIDQLLHAQVPNFLPFEFQFNKMNEKKKRGFLFLFFFH